MDRIIQLPPVTRTEYVYPRIPSDALTCLGEVAVPERLTMPGALDREAASFEDENRRAGADCRSKLDWVRDLVASWPKD